MCSIRMLHATDFVANAFENTTLALELVAVEVGS